MLRKTLISKNNFPCANILKFKFHQQTKKFFKNLSVQLM